MPRARPLLPSRLALAWGLLVLVVAGLAATALLTPRLGKADQGVVVRIPKTPDRYAAAVDPATYAPPELVGDLDFSALEAAPPEDTASPPVARAVAEAVDGADRAGAVRNMADALAEEGEGALVITIPQVEAEQAAARGAPEAALMRQGAFGPRPTRAADGRRPFDVYRLAPAPATGGASLALVVAGLGIDQSVTRRAIAGLPPGVTLSFAPYAKDLPVLLAEARAAGHETMIEVPMGAPGIPNETLGPAVLAPERAVAANLKRLDWIMSRAPAYPAVTTYFGEGFLSDRAAAGPVLEQLAEAGVGLLDDTGLGRPLAARYGVPYRATDLLIAPGGGNVAAELTLAAGPTLDTGPRLAKIYGTAASLDAVLDWINSPAATRVRLVPASSTMTE